MVSTRLASGKLPTPKRANVKDLTDEEDSDEDFSETESQVRPRKKGKTSGTEIFYQRMKGGKMKPVTNTKGEKPRGENVGKLEKIADIPMELFCEITSYLKPFDILELSRTSNKLHNMLCSRQSGPIWRVARKNVPHLPDCPPDLSEAQYARLLFAPECHSCGVFTMSKPDYRLRKRLCTSCKKAHIIKGSQLLRQFPKLKVEILDILPFRYDKWRPKRRASPKEYFYFPAVEALLKRFKSMKKSNTAWDKYHKEQKALVSPLPASATELVRWEVLLAEAEEIDAERSLMQELERVQQRDQSIRTMLHELGYDEIDLPPRSSDGTWEDIVGQKPELTSSYWASILPEVEACIRDYKARKLEIARQERESNRKAEISHLITPKLQFLRETSFFSLLTTPHMSDIYQLPSVASLITAHDSWTPITNEMWARVLDDVLDEIEEHKKRVRKDLQTLVLEARQEYARSLGDRGHTASIHKESSAEDISLDSLDCLFFYDFMDPGILVYPSLLGDVRIKGRSWRVAPLQVHQSALGIVHALLHYLPFSIDGAVLNDVQSMGERFVCLSCDEKVRMPMTWVELVQHFYMENTWFKNADAAPLSQFARPRCVGESRKKYRAFVKDTNNLTRSTIHNDHSLDSSEPLVAFLRYRDAHKQTDTISDLQQSWGARLYRCGLCPNSLRKVDAHERMILHIRHKHLKEATDEDILDAISSDFD